MLRSAVRRWLGVPSREEVRVQILREIDADAVWRQCRDPYASLSGERLAAGATRNAAIELGKREDTRG